MIAERRVRVLFVCLGNICRSPTAHAVFESMVAKEGLSSRVRISSGGTAGYHEGEPPDRRSQLHGHKRGYDLSKLRARQLRAADYLDADYVLAMDRENIANIARVCPKERIDRVQLFLDFAPEQAVREVPDPYYGGPDGFEQVIDLVEAASLGFIEHVRR